ncbi:uncharacterized protein LOC124925688 [Impatiens glandulifera]|uniref:uncharacterized protein LOC124925688 n=1 Tax=Impatiens glandulifera TaxID=253017 RepID=UPI001FB18A29|nr:uncharacterized protein LOC124925688 [Impatiens glandulifera]
MIPQASFLSNTIFPNPFLSKSSYPLRTVHISVDKSLQNPKPFTIRCHSPPFLPHESTNRRDVRSYAGRSKKTPGEPSSGRIEGSAELRKEVKRNAHRRSRKLAENLFYRLKNPHKNYPDNFSEEELQMIGLGYDRLVRFMDKDDPNLRHPHDWYKYGQFGPYSWRGVVLGEPIRPSLSDEYVSMIGEVRDQEEWEKIERFEMAEEFGKQMNSMDKKNGGLRYYWVFVRHPKWRVSDLPWEQWTLVSEVVLEARKQRLDKWNLMGRLGNNSRASITQCAAWFRPDILYVKRPVYQCRFEPQEEFFKGLAPLLNPETEGNFLCELEDEDGNVQLVTYFGGLCKLVKVNQKAFVDDVVKGYEKLSDEKKSKCLQFLLGNHPFHLLHPYTKEWKAKLEEMEMGCDAPEDDDDDHHSSSHGNGDDENEMVDWIDDENNDDIVLDMDEIADDEDDDELGIKDEYLEEEEEEEKEKKHWEDEFKKALSSSEEMENLVKRSIESNNKVYEKQMKMMGIDKEDEEQEEGQGENEMELRGRRAKVSKEEWRRLGYGRFRKRVKRSIAPPGLFLRAAVRPFTYKNLVKEIVLTRHAFLDGEIGKK